MSRDTSFFQTIKERAPLDDYLTKHLNTDLVPSGPGRRGAICPFHEEDTPSFVLYEADGTDPWQHWHCFGACAEGGTIIDAVMRYEPSVTDVTEAAEFLNELYDLGLEANSEAYKRFKKTVEETRAEKERAQEEMANPESRVAAQAKAYLHNRGYSDEAIAHFELGVDLKQTRAGRLSIPIFDKMGQAISVANRALFDKFNCRACGEAVTAKEMVKRRYQNEKAGKKGEEPPHAEWKACPHCAAPEKEAKVAWLTGQHPKYLFLRDFDKAQYLYHEHHARGPLFKDENVRGLYLAEGYPDVWAGWQAGHISFCAYSGSVISDEQARKAVELAKKALKPVVLVPDFDETGQGRFNAGSGVDANIRKIRAIDATVEVQVIHGLDKLDPPCKDLGEVLQFHSVEKVNEVLNDNRWPAGEWQIRQILEAKNAKTGENFHSKTKEMELIGEILSGIKTRESLDHLIPTLSEHWNIREEQGRNFFYAHISTTDQVSAQHLFKDIETAQRESAAFLSDSNVIPLGFDELDACFPGGGVRPGQLMMMLGKAQPLDAAVLTPHGWKRMGDMNVGDDVINPEGGTAQVVGVFPQGEREISRVTFSDGATTECDREHLWKIMGSEGHHDWEVLTLAELERDGARNYARERKHIPVPEPIEFAMTTNLPLDPYLLGALLGKGNLERPESEASNPSADQELAELIAGLLPSDVARGVPADDEVGGEYAYGFVGTAEHERTANAAPEFNNTAHVSLATQLDDRGKQMDALLGSPSAGFVPEEYLHASVFDRLELLRGLMDWGGRINVQAPPSDPDPLTSAQCPYGCEFNSLSRELSTAVQYLVRSLGGTAVLTAKNSAYCQPYETRQNPPSQYRVRVSLPPNMTPFKWKRKAALWERQQTPQRYISRVEPVGMKTAQCISLNSLNQLYITDDFVVTHNSGTGKAQPLDAEVLTPAGWRRMGELAVGDEVTNPEGGVARITGVYPQGERDIYRVSFDDGSSTECDLDHLWKVRGAPEEEKGDGDGDGNAREGSDKEEREGTASDADATPSTEWRIRELGDIIRDTDLESVPQYVPLVQAVNLDRGGDRSLDPYLLGAFIGARKQRGPGNLTQGSLIPKSYLWAPANDRLELLRGLMDAAGTVAGNSQASGGDMQATAAEFIAQHRQLATDIIFLTRSLGGTASIVDAHPEQCALNEESAEAPQGDVFAVRIFMPVECTPFRLLSKTQRYSPGMSPTRRMCSVEFVGRKPAQCISIDSANKLYITDDFIVTHNTMLASQMLANMADRDINCLFFSLEQGAGSFYPRLATQALDRPGSEVEELIKSDAPELEKVRNLYSKMLLIDNVPTETQEAISMTPGKVQSIIQEANLTHFEGRPVDVVIIDHLGILEVSEEAPSEIRKSETAAPGWIMKELFKASKATRVFMIVLQQLPKQVPAGAPVSFDAGWGGQAQTAFCDYIIQIWRPEQAADLDDSERLEVEGQYKIALGKNRFGASTLAHYFFDKSTLRILPPLRIAQPKVENDDGDDEIMFMGSETDMPAPAHSHGSEAGATEAGLQALLRATPDPVPRDTQQLLDALGAVEDDGGVDPHEDDPFGSSGMGSADDLFDIS